MIHRRRFSHESLLFFALFSFFFRLFCRFLLAFLPLFYLSFFFLFWDAGYFATLNTPSWRGYFAALNTPSWRGYFAALNTPRSGRAIAAQYARLARYVLVSLRAYARLRPAVVNSQFLTLRLRVVHVAHFWRIRASLRFAPRIHSLSSTAKRVANNRSSHEKRILQLVQPVAGQRHASQRLRSRRETRHRLPFLRR